MFNWKHDADGDIEQHKTWLVAEGFNQICRKLTKAEKDSEPFSQEEYFTQAIGCSTLWQENEAQAI